MVRLNGFLYKLGLPWSGPAPKTRLDKYFNRPAKVKAVIRPELNGWQLDDKTLQILAACPAGGCVSVKLMHGQVIRLAARHDKYIDNENHDTNLVEIRREATGYVLYLDYIWFAQNVCPAGIGAVALLRMAQVAQSLNFVRMELLAAGGTGIKGVLWAEPYWGFSTWPRFGFDAPVQQAIRPILETQPHLAGLRYVSEIIAKDLDWWKVNGDGWEMTFDLKPDSKSWQTLHRYLSEKGLKS